MRRQDWSTYPAELPFIDAHAIEVNAPPERVWDVLVHNALRRFGGGAGPLGPLGARLLGCPYADPPPPEPAVPETLVGFRVERAERPSLIALAGEHRFALYALSFLIDPADGARSRLTAETRAAFPGAKGRLYRAGVIGSGGHVLVVTRLLAHVRRRAERG